MNILNDYLNYKDLLTILNSNYHLNLEEINLHRKMIGHVYFANNKTNKYVLKIYRSFNSNQAIQAIDIMLYLKKNNYPVINLLPNFNGEYYINISLPEGNCIGILYDYVDGIEPNFKTELSKIGEQVALLHNIMANYPKPLISRGKSFYIDRFINILKELEYDINKTKDLEEYGSYLWKQMEKLPKGFCHGDLHSGNMLQTVSNEYVLFDFDVASYSYSIIDVTTLSNGTNFNKIDKSMYDNTLKTFELFYQGYSKYKTLSDLEIKTIFIFTAIRHYELIATITECESLDDLSRAFIDQQYNWLMKWKEICNG